jgi:hypothetical protein
MIVMAALRARAYGVGVPPARITDVALAASARAISVAIHARGL